MTTEKKKESYSGYVVFWLTSDGTYDNGVLYPKLKEAQECMAGITSDDKYIVRFTGTRL